MDEDVPEPVTALLSRCRGSGQCRQRPWTSVQHRERSFDFDGLTPSSAALAPDLVPLFKAPPYPAGDTNPCSTSEIGGNSNRRHRAGIYGTTGEEMPVKLPTDASFTLIKIRLQEMLVADAIRCDRVCIYRSNILLVTDASFRNLRLDQACRHRSWSWSFIWTVYIHPDTTLYITASSSSKHVAAYVVYSTVYMHKICQGVLEVLENNFVSVLWSHFF